jgi:hypothetical protein
MKPTVKHSAKPFKQYFLFAGRDLRKAPNKAIRQHYEAWIEERSPDPREVNGNPCVEKLIGARLAAEVRLALLGFSAREERLDVAH